MQSPQSVFYVLSLNSQALRAIGWLLLVACATATSHFDDDREWPSSSFVCRSSNLRNLHCAQQISLTSLVFRSPMLRSCPSGRPVFAELEAGCHHRPARLLVWVVRHSVFTPSVAQRGPVYFWTGSVLRHSWHCHWHVSQY